MPKLLEFTVGNYRSFCDAQTFTFRADRSILKNRKSTFLYNRHRLSTVSALYGANSSGKSNLIKGLAVMRAIMRESRPISPSENIYYDPFLLLSDLNREPQIFEAVISDDDGTVYTYGFRNSIDKIELEWLSAQPKGNGRSIPLFARDSKGIAINEELFPEGKDLEEKTSEKTLFLSVCAFLNGTISMKILEFMTVQTNVISGIEHEFYTKFTRKQFADHSIVASKAKEFLLKCDLGLLDIEVKQKKEKNDSGMETVSYKVLSTHEILDMEGNAVATHKFPFELFESEGTKKLFDLSGPVFDTLDTGGVLVVDELDAKLHPILTRFLIYLFLNPETNKLHAQLLFATHDSNLLNWELLRRDQIWFVKKDNHSQSILYRASEVLLPDESHIPEDADIEKLYMRGRLGAVPLI